MDDLFSAFDAPAPVVVAAKASAPAPPAADESAVGRKRPRTEAAVADDGSSSTDEAAAAPIAKVARPADAADGAAESASSASHAATAAAAAEKKKGKARNVGAAIDEAAAMNLDPHRNERMIDFTAAGAPEETADGPASRAAASTSGAAGQSAASHVPRDAVGGAAAGAGAGAAPTRLMRGEIDASKTTAPEAGEMDFSGKTPAKAYPFTLDPFQRRAIECLERDESVLVSAHTSAGKTVVAEYAIAMALRDKQRVIYTSPIKALSNQKYRDLFEEFSDVGLMTGDVTINPNASCLVMTTEILRSMLYRGSEIMREVKWCIFDEIHYMRDKERGVVWEESIIMLPHKVRFVFLSATIPNSKEFAEWIAKIHHQTCHVVYTDYRPTPLQHFIYPSGGDGVYLVVDERGKFREDNFNKAMAAMGNSALGDAVEDVVAKGGGKKGAAKGMGKGKATTGGDKSDLYRIAKMIMERNYDPVIVFSFSKRECEQYALQIAKLDITTADEKKLIEQVFLNAIDSLSEDDRKLPQISAILPLLKRGIGIHHGGLLPILKEVIEILFQESLLKVLFATETFSMGINMPARTVVFTASRKFDGTDFRWISAGEYIQMSGRAGRRGLDDRGIVIQMCDEKMEPDAAKDILKGCADPLNSAFHLGYNMLLNLMRVEGADPERMMQLSFHQFQSERAAPAMQAELAALQDEQAAIVVADEPAVAEYHQLQQGLAGVQAEVRQFVTKPQFAAPFLQPGRLLRIVAKAQEGGAGGDAEGNVEWGWGAVINFFKRSAAPDNAIGANMLPAPGSDEAAAAAASAGAGRDKDKESVVVVDLLLPVRVDTAAAPAGGRGGRDRDRAPKESFSPAVGFGSTALVPAAGSGDKDKAGSSGGGKVELRVISVVLPAVAALSSIRLYMPKDLRQREARDGMGDRLKEVHRRFPGGLPLLDPAEDMQIDTPEFRAVQERRKALQAQLEASALHRAADRDGRLAAYGEKLLLESKCAFLRQRIKACQSLVMRDTLKHMKRVLRRLGHINGENVVQTKGRVACEVNTADELLVTELIFNGAFNDLDCAQAAALLSCMVFSEKGDDDTAAKLPEELAAPFRALQQAARRIAEVSTDCRIEMDVEEYVGGFKAEMMPLVHAWVNGAKFVEIMGMTTQFEGSIIRVIRRLEELCRQLGDAARAIGDEGLERKFKEASAKMRRDIIFAASLYL